ncbi:MULTISPECIES: type II secretion system F family protein [unclassified Rathayibacter]|uniref:type II secretion system F family protein n=1 Tax=unclassified Rathayibacter TaxID=2609250 RepID=UPI00188C662E|nr:MULTISPECIES: type II secretion system F family protein [unclassified Rathayibacter]MBF4462864.1 type II secretion system F family protein [Rathayibacter sp. VKM Ac-2879]MBF4504278.1 type II secretion system F family protein [Rathayibacter sp. VKM Ac-2878]
MSRAEGLDEVAAVVQRLSVLLAAGVAPASALAHLAAVVGPGAAAARRRRLLRAVAVEAGRGRDVTEAILRGAPAARLGTPRGVWRTIPVRRRRFVGASSRGDEEAGAWAALAAAWRVASDSGAPVAAALAELAESMRELARARRDIDVALAGPAATGRVVGALPIVALGFGGLLGFDVIGVLTGTLPGVVCLAGGLMLMATAQLWTRRLVRGASPTDPAPGLALDLLAVALAGGSSVGGARDRVLAALDDCGLAAGVGTLDAAEAVLGLSSAAGVPAGRLLRSEAALTRVRAASAARERAARLGVTLMLPLGVCVLPSFLLLGVAPMVIAVLFSTFAVAA